MGVDWYGSAPQFETLAREGEREERQDKSERERGEGGKDGEGQGRERVREALDPLLL